MSYIGPNPDGINPKTGVPWAVEQWDEAMECTCGYLPSGGRDWNSKCPIHGLKRKNKHKAKS